MINDQTIGGGRGGNGWRIAGWGLAVFLLALPFVAMQMTNEVNWSPGDFVFAAVLFGSVGLAIEFLVRMSDNAYYRWGAVVAVLTAFLTVWVNAAVGMIGDGDTIHVPLFGALLVFALIGCVAVRFRSRGMARVMLAVALAQAAIAASGLAIDPRGALLSMAFAAPWLLAAALFHAAHRDGARAQPKE